jgi:hypothetical protein
MKMKKIFLYGGLGFLAIIVAAVFFLGRYTDRVIDPYVRSLLNETKPMGHVIEYKKIRVNLFRHFIIIKDVRMYPDTSQTRKGLRLELNVKEIRLTGFSIWQVLRHKNLRIKDLVVENPEVKLTLPDQAEQVVQAVRKGKPARQGAPLLTRISLEKIVFSGGSFQLIRDSLILATSHNINLLAESIALARNTMEEPIGYTYGEIRLSLSDISLYSKTGLYDMDLDGVSFRKSDSTIMLTGFSMIPKYDKKEFSKKLKFQNDRFDVKIGEVKIRGIGIQRFLAGKPLEIAAVEIDSIDADIYRDKNVQFNFSKFPPFYNESFLKIPVPLQIDTVEVTNSKLLYGELTAGHPKAGTILLEKFSAQSYNLGNQPVKGTEKPVMKFNVQALVMGEGPMKAELILPLEGNLRDIQCSGSVGAMQLKPLNDMLEPAIGIRFQGGSVTRMTFAFTGNDNLSKGWMEFLYKDIDVSLVKKKPDKEWGFVSALANWVAVSNNPSAPGKDPKIVEIGFERDKNKGLINYVWKTIQSGMVRTIIPTGKHTIKAKKDKKKSK